MVMSGKGDRFGKWRYVQICKALGLDPSSAESTDFLGKTFEAELGIDPGNEQNGPKNVIKNVLVG